MADDGGTALALREPRQTVYGGRTRDGKRHARQPDLEE
jgi:hypothetical protein